MVRLGKHRKGKEMQERRGVSGRCPVRSGRVRQGRRGEAQWGTVGRGWLMQARKCAVQREAVGFGLETQERRGTARYAKARWSGREWFGYAGGAKRSWLRLGWRGLVKLGRLGREWSSWVWHGKFRRGRRGNARRAMGCRSLERPVSSRTRNDES